MIGRGGRDSWIRFAGWATGLAVLLAGTSAPAQTAEPPPFLAASADSSPAAIYDSDVIQAGCSSCGGNSLLRPNLDGDFTGCADGHCNGHKPCYPCEGKTCIGRFECALYHCICCPDPCYEPRWLPVADAAFFTESARPITQQRFRWDSGLNVRLADRAGYFFGQAGLFGPPLPIPAKPPFAPVNFNYNELSVYTEAAAKRVSLFIDYPYRSIENGEGISSAAGFGDLCIGTKTLLFDCELMQQIAMQNKTWIPLGIPIKGLGTGHVSLELSLLAELKLGADTYLQSQLSEWIPFGGGLVAGPILHYHLSCNQVVCKPLPDVPIIGTCEFSGWSFQDGSFSDPQGQLVNGVLAPALVPASGFTYLYLGAGLRMVVCDRLDCGVGVEFSLQHQHWADPLFRTEFRFRY